MRLTVTVVESKEIIGTFTLTRGNAGRIRKCTGNRRVTNRAKTRGAVPGDGASF